MIRITRSNLKKIIPNSPIGWMGIVNTQTEIQLPTYREMYRGESYNRVRYITPKDIIELMENRIIGTQHLNSHSYYLPMWKKMIKLCKSL